jgi:hypothetical protein
MGFTDSVPEGRLNPFPAVSAVPPGLVEVLYVFPGLDRPGLSSGVPTGLSLEWWVARSGLPWEKITKGDVASVYTSCETAITANDPESPLRCKDSVQSRDGVSWGSREPFFSLRRATHSTLNDCGAAALNAGNPGSIHRLCGPVCPTPVGQPCCPGDDPLPFHGAAPQRSRGTPRNLHLVLLRDRSAGEPPLGAAASSCYTRKSGQPSPGAQPRIVHPRHAIAPK